MPTWTRAVATAVGWEKLAASVPRRKPSAWPIPTRPTCQLWRPAAWPVLHRLGPVFLEAFKLRAVPPVASTLRAIELLHDAYRSDGRTWPHEPAPSASCVRPGVRRSWAPPTLAALSVAFGKPPRCWRFALDRLRAGDIWVEGGRRWRAVEDQAHPARVVHLRSRAAGPLLRRRACDCGGLSGRRAPRIAGPAACGRVDQGRRRRARGCQDQAGDDMKIQPAQGGHARRRPRT